MAEHFDVRGLSQTFSKNTFTHHVSDTDEAADTKYYGFISHIGSWVIMQEITSAGSYRYAVGKNDYSTNWTGRAGLSYNYYNEVFS